MGVVAAVGVVLAGHEAMASTSSRGGLPWQSEPGRQRTRGAPAAGRAMVERVDGRGGVWQEVVVWGVAGACSVVQCSARSRAAARGRGGAK